MSTKKTRKITIFDGNTSDNKEYTSSAQTWGELQKELGLPDVCKGGVTYTEGNSGTSFKSLEDKLPETVVTHEGITTEDLSIYMFTTRRIKSGMYGKK